MMTETQPAVNQPTNNNSDNSRESEQVPLQLCQRAEKPDGSEPGKAEEPFAQPCLENPPLIARLDDPIKTLGTDGALIEPTPHRLVYWMPEQKGPWNLIHDTRKGREWAIKRGAMFISWAPLSHEPKDGEPEPHRWGDFPFDFDDGDDPGNALSDLNKLVMGICLLYHLDFNAIQYYASGSKGFHVIIPAEVFGAEDGDPYLPLIFKRIASRWKAEFELGTMDLSIYNMKKGRLLRVANVQRNNGRYKVPLKPEEVGRLSIEVLMEFTKAPREIDRPPVELKANEALAKLYRETKDQICREIQGLAAGTPLSPEQREKLKETWGAGSGPLSKEQLERFNETLPPCIRGILDLSGKKSGSTFNFNALLLVLIKFFQDARLIYDQALDTCSDFIERYPSKTYSTSAERFREFRAKWDYLQNNDSYTFTCNYARGLKLPPASFDCRKCNIWEPQDPVEKVVHDLNQSHAVIFCGKCFILTEFRDQVTGRPDIAISSPYHLKLGYSNQKIRLEGPKAKMVNPVDLWLDHKDRREYRQIIFDPGRDIAGCYNLWKGLAVQPHKGDWSVFSDHLRNVICDGNEDHYRYLLSWMAHTVQQLGGERPGVSIVLRGKQGTGKGCFVENFGRIFGNHFVHVANQRHFTGNFNFHLKDCLLLHADEAFWAGTKADEGMLKYLITEPHLVIEPKKKDAFSVTNRIRLIVSSNNSWAVPAGLEERRFFVLDVSDRHQQDHKYFGELFQLMRNGGTEAMLYDLLEMDVSGLNLREAPRTEALFDQIKQSMDGFTSFWFERLKEGTLLESHDEWKPCVSKSELYNAYLYHTSASRGKYPHSRDTVTSKSGRRDGFQSEARAESRSGLAGNR
jgi:hypothetical protein